MIKCFSTSVRIHFLWVVSTCPDYIMSMMTCKNINFFNKIYFCGQLSDPIHHPNFVEILKLCKDTHVVIHNASSHKPRDYFIECFKANPNAHWVFGIDGLPEESHNYRIHQDGVKLFNIMLDAKKILQNPPTWQILTFKYNEDKKDVKDNSHDHSSHSHDHSSHSHDHSSHSHDHSSHSHDHSSHSHDHSSHSHDHSSHSHDHSSHSHDHSSHSHDLSNNIEGFTSVSYETSEPFSLRKFQYFLDNQISENGFRAKGILWFMESERKHIFHLSGKRFSLDDEEWTKEKSNKIVLIGKNLDHQTIKNQLSSCRFSTD